MVDRGQDIDDDDDDPDPVLFTYVTGQQLLAELAGIDDETNEPGPGGGVRIAASDRRPSFSWGQLVDAFARVARLASLL